MDERQEARELRLKNQELRRSRIIAAVRADPDLKIAQLVERFPGIEKPTIRRWLADANLRAASYDGLSYVFTSPRGKGVRCGQQR